MNSSLPHEKLLELRSTLTALSSRHNFNALPWHIIIPTLIITYLSLVQVLRFRALRKLEHKFAAYVDNPYSLNYKEAREILHLPLLNDMPFLFAFGTQWALIKSYGIATGTPLLVATRQLSDPDKVGKRAEDTGVFIIEFLVGDIDSERGRLAVSRLNWLHRRYKILEGDYVHTLALFVLEPQRWIERYEWRAMTRLEKVAHFIYWREIGHRMGFGGIPETLEELEVWKAEYEKTHLYYIDANRIVTDATMELFLRKSPRFLHGFVRSLFVAFIEEKNVREALGYGDPPLWAVALTKTFFKLRGLMIRHLFLPRSKPLEPLAKQDKDGKVRRSPEYFGFEPWYIEDTWWNRLRTWMRSGYKLMPGEGFQSSGYRPEELGPKGTETIAKESIIDQAKAMEDYVKRGGSEGMGCPFKFG